MSFSHLDIQKKEYEIIDLILSGLSIFRWNTFPRVQSITALDHLGFVCHISLLIAHLRAEEEWEKYDIGLLLKKILFSGFFTFFYSDISAEVKDRIREKSPELYMKLEEDVEKKLLLLHLSRRVQDDIILIQEKTKEDDIIWFAKMWASYYEIQHNAKIYPHAYAKLLKDMKKRSEKKEFLPFSAYLSFDPNDQNELESYLLIVHRLASSFRWNRSVRKYPISVLSHTFFIAFLTYLISSEAWIPKDEQTDMIMTALFHDIPEAITGDIITPTKKAIPGLDIVIEEVERDMIYEHILSYIRRYSFSDIYAKKMLSPWHEAHGDMVKHADILSAFHEARIEAPLSEVFQRVCEELFEKLKKFEK